MEMSFVFFVILFTGKICDAAAFQGDKSQEEKNRYISIFWLLTPKRIWPPMLMNHDLSAIHENVSNTHFVGGSVWSDLGRKTCMQPWNSCKYQLSCRPQPKWHIWGVKSCIYDELLLVWGLQFVMFVYDHLCFESRNAGLFVREKERDNLDLIWIDVVCTYKI